MNSNPGPQKDLPSEALKKIRDLGADRHAVVRELNDVEAQMMFLDARRDELRALLRTTFSAARVSKQFNKSRTYVHNIWHARAPVRRLG